MEVRRFGSTDLRVSAIGLGCARIGGVFQGGPGGFLDLLSAALDAGVNFFDTADIYCQGESEVLLGRAFRRRRERVIIASKAGYRLPAQRRIAGFVKPLLRPMVRMLGLRRRHVPSAVRGELAQDFSPPHLRRAVEGSLRRLRTDRLDLFQLHSPPAEVVERGDWTEALERLRGEGKIRHWGISCDTVESGLATLRHAGVASLQLTANLLEHRAVDALLPPARARRIAVIARECLANGLLVKPPAETDLAAYCRSRQEEAERAGQLAALRQAACAEGRSLVELALRYVQELDGVSVALIGARSVQQLEAVLGAAGRARAPAPAA
jgi:aryl-alcohol dehydrogenase-like predicted oxidoreductase